MTPKLRYFLVHFLEVSMLSGKSASLNLCDLTCNECFPYFEYQQWDDNILQLNLMAAIRWAGPCRAGEKELASGLPTNKRSIELGIEANDRCKPTQGRKYKERF